MPGKIRQKGMVINMDNGQTPRKKKHGGLPYNEEYYGLEEDTEEEQVSRAGDPDGQANAQSGTAYFPYVSDLVTEDDREEPDIQRRRQTNSSVAVDQAVAVEDDPSYPNTVIPLFAADINDCRRAANLVMLGNPVFVITEGEDRQFLNYLTMFLQGVCYAIDGDILKYHNEQMNALVLAPSGKQAQTLDVRPEILYRRAVAARGTRA